MSDPPLQHWARLVRPHDLVWLLLFPAMAATTEVLDVYVIVPLVALAVAQVLEPKIPQLASTRGRILWIVLKMALGYVLIGYTGSIASNYWLVLLLPVVSAATVLGVLGTLVFSMLAGAAYLSFLLYLDFTQVTIEWPVVLLRVLFLAMAGNLANLLAEDLRIQSRNYRRTAEQLAEANLQIQQAEEAVRRSDRLAALGQLSAGLAHELRNPLGTIKTSAEMLARRVSSENEVAREVAGFISLRKSTAPIRWSRAFCSSPAPSRCAWTARICPKCSTVQWPRPNAKSRRSRSTKTTSPRSRPSRSTPN